MNAPQKVINPKFYKKAMKQCPYFSELTEKEQQEYISLAPFKNNYIWWAILIGFGLIIIIVYYTYKGNEITKFNFEFKKTLDERKAKEK